MSKIERVGSTNAHADHVSDVAVRRANVIDKINLIEQTVKKTDCDLQYYILKAVTEGLSYTHLKSRLDIPCSRDTYYDRYRRFFWILDKTRN